MERHCAACVFKLFFQLLATLTVWLEGAEEQIVLKIGPYDLDIGSLSKSTVLSNTVSFSQ